MIRIRKAEGESLEFKSCRGKRGAKLPENLRQTIKRGGSMTEKIIVQPLPGYKEVKPFVYAGFFPVSNEDYNDLKDSN